MQTAALFTAGTVHALLDSGGFLTCPVCQGQTGHPILIGAELFEKILLDTGEQGLKGAVERCGVPMEQICVEDPGTLHDADTPAYDSALVDYHNAQLVHPVITVSLNKEKPFLDDQIAMLLALVDETHSVRAASQRMQLSYSSCWNMIRTLESQLNCTLIQRSQGGAGGSQSHLTPRAHTLLSRFSEYERRVREEAEALYEAYFGGLFP